MPSSVQQGGHHTAVSCQEANHENCSEQRDSNGRAHEESGLEEMFLGVSERAHFALRHGARLGVFHARHCGRWVKLFCLDKGWEEKVAYLEWTCRVLK